MTDKKPQTCYVPSEDRTDNVFMDKYENKIFFATQLPDRYIFTKEELEERDRSKMREAAEKAWDSCLEAIYADPMADVEIAKQKYLDTHYASPNKQIEDEQSNT